VDARALSGYLQAGRWAEALKVLHKTMPLPGILGRICDAPCRLACNRKDLGGAIRIEALEHACVQNTADKRRAMPLPAKGLGIAVIGGGLSSLTVAWDLARKGYGVTVSTAEGAVGAGLLNQYPQRLSREAFDREITLLTSLGVRFQTAAIFSSAAECWKCREAHDAVYVGLDAAGSDPWGIDPTAEPIGAFGTTTEAGVFAGGNHASPVWQTAQGRWAATSMDRWLQKVSLTAGREREGQQETRLFTNLDGILPKAAVAMADPSTGYSEGEALAEAERCLQCQCLECVKVCAYLEQFGAYPRRYVREIYNNESLVLGERKANRLINSCSLCGLCETVCPHDFAMQDLCLAARQSMVARGKMPPSAHEFALQDMAFSQSERFHLARHEPGRSTSAHLFFPGCQLCASSPHQVTQIYGYLRKALSDGVALMLGCCGAPAHWSGRSESFTAELDRWKADWTELERPRPIMACASCLRLFKDHVPEADAVSLWEVIDAAGLPEGILPRLEAPLAVHDPCTTRGEEAVQDAVRRLLSHMGVPHEELQLGREHTECCGFGGLMQNANPALARTVAEDRGRRSARDYVVYCAMCRDSLAAAGKRTLHLLDLFFPDPDQPDPAARLRPGWSERRENRLRLKDDLARDLWNEPSANADALPVLLLDPEVEERLESRRILKEDIQKVLRHVQNGGQAFRHPDTGHWLASFRPYQATFWVAFSPLEEGYCIHNAYAHRMEVLGP
jgi:Fe-S oxidoreductase